jgi:hypothetical protein
LFPLCFRVYLTLLLLLCPSGLFPSKFIDRISWTGDQPYWKAVIYMAQQREKKGEQISMPRMGFGSTILSSHLLHAGFLLCCLTIRNVGSHTNYTALYQRRRQYSSLPL